MADNVDELLSSAFLLQDQENNSQHGYDVWAEKRMKDLASDKLFLDEMALKLYTSLTFTSKVTSHHSHSFGPTLPNCCIMALSGSVFVKLS